jgi:hypothetical protein
MAESKVPIKVVQTDLVGDCPRLNRRFDLVEGRASALETSIAATAKMAASAAAAAASATSPSGSSGVVSYGTHAARLSQPVPATGTLYVETDRNEIVYQFQGIKWVYVSGVMRGTFAQRPTDLGTSDAGFLFSSSDKIDYRWNGAAWTSVDTVRGGTALVDVNRITKITAAGVAGESSISDDGTVVSTTEPILVDEGAAPPASQIVARANALGAISATCRGVDNSGLGFDVDLSGSAWLARNASIAMLYKNAALLAFYGSVGNTVGMAATLTTRALVDLATGFWRFGDGTVPTYSLEAAGDALIGLLIRSYNGAPTKAMGVPAIYDEVNLLSSPAASIGTTALQVNAGMAPKGLYRVAVYVITTTAAGTDTLTTTIGWHDGTIARTAAPVIQLNSTGATGIFNGEITVQSDGAHDITYATTRSAATGTPAYSLRITIERLQKP